MKRRKFDQIVCEIARELNDKGYSIDTVDTFIAFSRSLSKRFPDDETDVNIIAAGNEHLKSLATQLSKENIRHKRRQLRFVTSYVETGQVDVSYADRVHREHLGACHNQLLDDYRESLVASGKREATIIKWDGYAYRFLKYLEGQNIVSISDLASTDIDRFIAWVSNMHMITGLNGELTMLRSLLFFTDDRKQTKNAVWWVPKGRYLRPAPVPIYQDEELQRLFGAIDRDTALGKRDFAIMLIALEMGLRASDIVTMRLGDIDNGTTRRSASAK
jgi:hypothetical protein